MDSCLHRDDGVRVAPTSFLRFTSVLTVFLLVMCCTAANDDWDASISKEVREELKRSRKLHNHRLLSTVVGEQATSSDPCSHPAFNFCHQNAICVANTSSTRGYSCDCKEGYVGDGFGICGDFDECTHAHPCPPEESGGYCVNRQPSNSSDGGPLMYSCGCRHGYIPVSTDKHGATECGDIDECSIGAHNCNPVNATCINNKGGFDCKCNDGYDGDGHNCLLAPGSIESGADAEPGPCAECDPVRQVCDEDKTCVCADGYFSPSGRGDACQSRDECTDGTHDCHVNAFCVENDGGYDCICKNGFEGFGRSCSNEDECAKGLHDCHANATCIDTDGSFDCACKQGYEGDGKSSCQHSASSFPSGSLYNIGAASTNLVPSDQPLSRNLRHGGSENLYPRDLQASGVPNPSYFFEESPNVAPNISFTLTWDTPTSDLDLYVIEPNGNLVAYFNQRGTYGSLDVDDVEGFGTEHYRMNRGVSLSNPDLVGSKYLVRLNAYTLDQDDFANWRLVGRCPAPTTPPTPFLSPAPTPATPTTLSPATAPTPLPTFPPTTATESPTPLSPTTAPTPLPTFPPAQPSTPAPITSTPSPKPTVAVPLPPSADPPTPADSPTPANAPTPLAPSAGPPNVRRLFSRITMESLRGELPEGNNDETYGEVVPLYTGSLTLPERAVHVASRDFPTMMASSVMEAEAGDIEILHYTKETIFEKIKEGSSLLAERGVLGFSEFFSEQNSFDRQMELWAVATLWLDGGVILDPSYQVQAPLEMWASLDDFQDVAGCLSEDESTFLKFFLSAKKGSLALQAAIKSMMEQKLTLTEALNADPQSVRIACKLEDDGSYERLNSFVDGRAGEMTFAKRVISRLWVEQE